jgi:hypothetical protein
MVKQTSRFHVCNEFARHTVRAARVTAALDLATVFYFAATSMAAAGVDLDSEITHLFPLSRAWYGSNTVFLCACRGGICSLRDAGCGARRRGVPAILD